MPLPIPTDKQIKADCLDILASHERYDWPRDLTVDGHLWGDWLDAAATALDCGDYSEIRWMRDLPDDEAESAADFADELRDRPRDLRDGCVVSARLIHIACAIVNAGILMAFVGDAFTNGTVMLEGGPARPMGHDALLFGVLWCGLNVWSAVLGFLAKIEGDA